MHCFLYDLLWFNINRFGIFFAPTQFTNTVFKVIEYLASLPFDGFAIGGSLGKTREHMFELLDNIMHWIPTDHPNHLLGIGDLYSVEKCVTSGIDTFDSSHPTRAARHGTIFTKQGLLKLLNTSNKTNFSPIDATCQCYTCRHYSVAYLHHLLKAKEMTAYTLASIHNLYFMVQLMADYREKILNDVV